jgi:predicted RNA binding protein YcfA (HicA-like mRNA interferase family)
VNKRCLELLEFANNNPNGVRFSDLQKLCVCCGMWHDRTKGSHYVYKHANPSFTITIQELSDGKAKPYQVKQVLNFIELHNFEKEGENV